MEIVIAENQDGPAAQGAEQAQDFKGLAAAIHHVTAEDQSIRGGIETNPLEQSLQWPQATLNVADEVVRHVATFRPG